MTDRVVIFDKTTGEPIAMIQTADPTLILLNSDEDRHAIAPATEGDWRTTEFDPKTRKIKQKAQKAVTLSAQASAKIRTQRPA
jgi:hypothetical protein